MKHKRTLALALALTLLLSCTGFAPAHAAQVESEVPQFTEQSQNLPNTDTDDSTDNKYAERLVNEEQLNTHVYRNSDGTKTMYIYDHPVKYRDEQGQTHDISLDIADTDDTAYPFRTRANSAVTVFPASLPDGITLSGNGVNLRLAAQLPTGNVALNHKARRVDTQKIAYTYDAKTTIEYGLTYTGFKEDIVVSEYTGQTEYSFILYTNGLNLTNIDGSYYLTDSEGAIQASIGEVIVFTADERNNTFGTLQATTIKPGQIYGLTIVLDADYLADPKTVYPIRIDPTVELVYTEDTPNAIEEKTLQSNNTNSGSYGSTVIGLNAKGISRTIMKFPGMNFSALNGVLVESAVVTLRDLMCQSEEMTVTCYPFTGGAWTESDAQWANLTQNWGTALDSNVISYASGVQQDVAHRYRFDITELAQEWVNGTANESLGIIFRSPDAVENGTEYFYKTFATSERASYKPTFEITYTDLSGTDFAHAISLSLDTPININIANEGDYQYLSFTPATTGFYTIESVNSTCSSKVFLCNNEYQQIAQCYSQLDNDHFQLTYHLVRGVTYYYLVGAVASDTGGFDVRISSSPASATITTSTINLDSSYSVSIRQAFAAKYYAFTPTVTGEYLFFSSNCTADPDAWLYGSNFALVATGTSYGANYNFRVSATLTAGETYYLVASDYPSSVGSYDFTIWMAPTSLDSDFRIRNMGSELYLDIDTFTSIPNPCQYDYRGSIQAKWHITKRPDGYFTIQSAYNSQYYLGISSTAIGSSIELYSGISNNTLWKIYVKDNGEIFFEPKNAPGRVMAAADNSAGSELILKWMSDSLENRNVWKFEVQSSIEPEGQQTSYWCWAAASRMFVNHYNYTHIVNAHSVPTQAEAVSEIKGEALEYSGNPTDIMNVLSFYQTHFSDSEKLDLVYHPKIYGEETLNLFLNDGHVVLIGRYVYANNSPQSAHAYVISGYTSVFNNGSINYKYFILNPWPQNLPNPWNAQQEYDGQLHTWTHQQICNGVNFPTNDENSEKIWCWSITVNTSYSGDTIDPVL